MNWLPVPSPGDLPHPAIEPIHVSCAGSRLFTPSHREPSLFWPDSRCSPNWVTDAQYTILKTKGESVTEKTRASHTALSTSIFHHACIPSRVYIPSCIYIFHHRYIFHHEYIPSRIYIPSHIYSIVHIYSITHLFHHTYIFHHAYTTPLTFLWVSLSCFFSTYNKKLSKIWTVLYISPFYLKNVITVIYQQYFPHVINYSLKK